MAGSPREFLPFVPVLRPFPAQKSGWTIKQQNSEEEGMKTFTRLSRSLTALACTVAFAAVATASLAAADKTELKMVVWDAANTAYLKPLISAFEEKNPNVTISIIDIPANEYQDKLSIMLSGGETADIISVKDIPGYAGMVNRKQLEPLNALIKKDKVNLGLYSGVTDDIQVNGELYALPFRSDFWVLYYNKDLFDKAKVAYPTNDMTWQQYADLAKKVSSGFGTDRVYGTHNHTWRSTVQLPTVQDGKNSIITTDYSYMKPYYEMVLKLQADKSEMDYASLKVGNIHYSGVFYNNQIAMLPMGSWFISTVIAKHKTGEATMNWGVVKFPHPAGVAAGTTAGTITSLAVNKASKQKELAWNFVKFFSGPEGAQILAKVGNFPAIRDQDVVKILTSMDGFPSDDASKAALTTTKVRLEMPMHEKVGIIERILNEEHELIMVGSNSVDKGLSEMTRRVKEALAKQ